MTRSAEAEAYVLGEFEKREIPKLGGSSAAFIVLIVLLLLVILVAGGGIVYLLREDESTSADRWRVQRRMGVPKVTVAHGDLDDDDEEAGGHRSRGAYQRQGSSDSALPREGAGSGSGWAASVKRLFGKARRKTGRGRRHQAGDSSMLPTSDSSMLSPPLRRYSANPAPSGRQQGWMPAASESDWDLHQQTPTNFNSAPSNMRMGMVERRQTDSPVLSTNTHNLNTSPRSSYISGGPSHSYPSSYPYPYSASRMTTSDSMHSGSVVRFDDSVNVPRRHSGVPGGLGGGGGAGGPAPSILSGRYFASPTTSPTGSSTALPLASPTGMSPRSASPSPVHQYPSHSFSSPSPVVSPAAPSAQTSAPGPPSSSSSHGASSHSAGAPIRPAHAKQLPSRMTMTSASEVSLASASDSYSYPSHEYVLANHSPFPAPSPSIRTFGSGSRFVEGL